MASSISQKTYPFLANFSTQIEQSSFLIDQALQKDEINLNDIYSKMESKTVFSPPFKLFNLKFENNIPSEVRQFVLNRKHRANCGLSMLLNCAWYTIDNSLLFWNFLNNKYQIVKLSSEVLYTCEIIECPQSLARQFNNSKYLAFISSKTSIFICGFDQSVLKIFDMKKKTEVCNDGVIIEKIKSTVNGNVFMTAEDGNIYELVYQGWQNRLGNILFGYGRKISKIERGKPFEKICTAINQIFGRNGIFFDNIFVDNERMLLYALTKKGDLFAWIISDGNVGFTASLVDIINKIKQSHFLEILEGEKIKSLQILSPSELTNAFLFLVTNKGSRIFIRLTTDEKLKIVHVEKGNLPSTPGAPEFENVGTTKSFYSNKIFLFAANYKKDSVLVSKNNEMAAKFKNDLVYFSDNFRNNIDNNIDKNSKNNSNDNSPNKNELNGDLNRNFKKNFDAKNKENFDINCYEAEEFSRLESKVICIEETPWNYKWSDLAFYCYKRNWGRPIHCLKESAVAHLGGKREFVVLTHKGVKVYEYQNALGILYNIFNGSICHADTIISFLNAFGPTESCAMCLSLICCDQIENRFVEQRSYSTIQISDEIKSSAKSAFFTIFGSLPKPLINICQENNKNSQFFDKNNKNEQIYDKNDQKFDKIEINKKIEKIENKNNKNDQNSENNSNFLINEGKKILKSFNDYFMAQSPAKQNMKNGLSFEGKNYQRKNSLNEGIFGSSKNDKNCFNFPDFFNKNDKNSENGQNFEKIKENNMQNNDIKNIRFEESGKLSGLCAFVSRILRPIWNYPVVGDVKSLQMSGKIKGIVFSKDILSQIITSLVRLDRFITEYKKLFYKVNDEGLDEIVEKSYQAKILFSNCVKIERNRIEGIHKIILRSIEILKFLHYVSETETFFHKMFNRLLEEKQNVLQKSPFKNYVTKSFEEKCLKNLMAQLVCARGEEIEFLKENCPSLFGVDDVLAASASKIIEKAIKHWPNRNFYYLEMENAEEEFLNAIEISQQNFQIGKALNALESAGNFKGVFRISIKYIQNLADKKKEEDVLRRIFNLIFVLLKEKNKVFGEEKLKIKMNEEDINQHLIQIRELIIDQEMEEFQFKLFLFLVKNKSLDYLISFFPRSKYVSIFLEKNCLTNRIIGHAALSIYLRRKEYFKGSKLARFWAITSQKMAIEERLEFILKCQRLFQSIQCPSQEESNFNILTKQYQIRLEIQLKLKNEIIQKMSKNQTMPPDLKDDLFNTFLSAAKLFKIAKKTFTYQICISILENNFLQDIGGKISYDLWVFLVRNEYKIAIAKDNSNWISNLSFALQEFLEKNHQSSAIRLDALILELEVINSENNQKMSDWIPKLLIDSKLEILDIANAYLQIIQSDFIEIHSKKFLNTFKPNASFTLSIAFVIKKLLSEMTNMAKMAKSAAAKIEERKIAAQSLVAIWKLKRMAPSNPAEITAKNRVDKRFFEVCLRLNELSGLSNENLTNEILAK